MRVGGEPSAEEAAQGFPRYAAIVPTLEDALDWVERHAAGAERVEVELARGPHLVRRGLVLEATLPPLVFRGRGARVLGGVLHEHPAWRAAEPEVLARLPEEARGRVLALELGADEVAGWRGGLAGPVHSGHGVGVTAVHSELFVDGRPRTLARWPNAGFASIERLLDPGSVPRQAADDVPLAQRVVEPPRGGTFGLAEGARLARWAEEGELWAEGYWFWDWADEQLPVARVDAAAGTLTLGAPHTYGLGERARFFVVGALCELDAPGEYWIDRERACVYAWLEPGEERASCAVSLLAEPLFTLAGAREVTFDGLTFECTRGAALEARGVAGLRVERSTFRNVGTRAVALDGARSRVRASLFEDIGGVGVELSGGDRASLTAAGNAIEDCVFRRTARTLRTYNPAIRVAGVGQRVAHVEIAELPHIALAFQGNDHLIEHCEIHDVVRETGDAGAVYSGRDWTSQGTILRSNLFHSIAGSDARYQNAVYLDDMASGITVEQNLFVRCNWGLLIGGGRHDVVRRNAFVGCGKALVYDARGVGWMAAALADPSTSTLHRTFAAAPVTSQAWRARYPALPEYLSDRFGRPVGGEVVNNLLVGTPLGEIHDRECVTESGTRRLELEADELERESARWVAQIRRGPVSIGSLELGPVGPRVSVGAPRE